MLANNHAYEKWEERILSKENGKREIRYYLVSTSASPLLAVVGMEKRDRHYSYVVSEEFLQAIGPNPAINTNEKWTSRKNVKEWLESLVRENNQPPTNSNHYVPAHEGNGSDAITTSEVSGIPGPCGVQLEEPTPTEQASFQVNDDVELLIQDLDMPDCWCKCKIMDISKRRWKVQCNDMMDADGSGKLEQYVPPPRLARLDKLSMRHCKRLTIRPCPAEEDSPTTYKVGAAIDAWRNNRWWEGFILTGESLSNSDSYHVFLPGLGDPMFMTLHRRNLRPSRDWVNNIWVAVQPLPDVYGAIQSCYTQRGE
ncbi:uncharacterized protein LOC108210781 isoform X2 [Daucus carota subsp. sativus]|uniref:Agenet domain-containing protein n=2 Tax=Daucus carota subsp. sativus TaxID=79200 RepID=A0A161WSV2_DAUCS|nr:PREDICTED: uncharacterized protein LOC108210781 [Daucus carota subsp. sativus]XP_017237679.1 PREDICTED: uncharacterized protein LOC108210781 [Daucus carota subsp. sativus]XP_017237680.1 PREDICTED: uncharacterized protein LOC108210781 [Daucus carota subsp. sativus]XP_017237681.1 PREDICTED: uncharacterized protein LOC108210781 [Daucus carota subsp. sativus]XP_017237682.1 PREDICTED: uncharacterized protein LOC108210781 [Daucus carota subsp. sativus]XP_017237683.1 PREDICTED: uncharacterized pro